MHSRVFRVELRGTSKILGRLAVVLLFHVDVAQPAASRGIVGISLENFLEFGNGLLMVIERMQVDVCDDGIGVRFALEGGKCSSSFEILAGAGMA